MPTISGYHFIKPEDLHWRPSNLMKTPNADYLERTGSENLGARLWRLPPMSANTLHKHVRAEEFYFVLEGTGRMRVGDDTLTVPKYGAVHVGRRRNWSFCKAPSPRWIFPSFIPPTPRNCPRNSPARPGRLLHKEQDASR
jgi:hypothetical protein